MVDSEGLLTKNCVPCSKDTPVLREEQIASYLIFTPGFSRLERGLHQVFDFDSSGKASEFIKKVSELAGQQGHRPYVNRSGFRCVDIWLITQVVNGLTLNDFIMAAKINAIAFAVLTDQTTK